jgi:hypothetical protein
VIEDLATKDIEKYPDDPDEPVVTVGYDGGVSARWHAANKAAFDTARAYVQDGSSYRAEMMTAPDFGCVLHSPSPPQGEEGL